MGQKMVFLGRTVLAMGMLGTAGIFLPTAAWANGPSFDCRKASTPTETAICADPKLSAIDLLVAKAFKTFQPSFGGDKHAIARALITDRRQGRCLYRQRPEQCPGDLWRCPYLGAGL